MLAWCSGLERALTCVLGPGFNSRMVHFFSSTNNTIKSLQLLFCIDLYYYFYYFNIGCWGFQVESTWNPHGIYLSTWNPHEIHMEMGRNSCGTFHMDSKWKFHMEWWNPHGI